MSWRPWWENYLNRLLPSPRQPRFPQSTKSAVSKILQFVKYYQPGCPSRNLGWSSRFISDILHTFRTSILHTFRSVAKVAVSNSSPVLKPIFKELSWDQSHQSVYDSSGVNRNCDRVADMIHAQNPNSDVSDKYVICVISPFLEFLKSLTKEKGTRWFLKNSRFSTNCEEWIWQFSQNYVGSQSPMNLQGALPSWCACWLVPLLGSCPGLWWSGQR